MVFFEDQEIMRVVLTAAVVVVVVIVTAAHVQLSGHRIEGTKLKIFLSNAVAMEIYFQSRGPKHVLSFYRTVHDT